VQIFYQSRTVIAVPNAGHMDIPDQLVIKAMLDFFQE